MSYNALEELMAVVDSVLALNQGEIELIVVDGGSSDGTVDYLQAHSDKIDFWISEPDRGIYDAMNKAIRLASGMYLLHLNAGDRLLHVPYEELKQGLDDDMDILAFRVALKSSAFFIAVRMTFGDETEAKLPEAGKEPTCDATCMANMG